MSSEPIHTRPGDEQIYELDAETLSAFASKGVQPGKRTTQSGLNNAVKVRRVMQVTRDFATVPFPSMRVLDLACGEGVYSIEAGLRGASVLGVDARTERMQIGERTARGLGLRNVRFEQRDVRAVNRHTDGEFDVIFFLGILYHLDFPDSLSVLEQLAQMCRGIVVIDTHVALKARSQVEHAGRTYCGLEHAEHGTGDSSEARRSRLLSSIDNARSYWFTRDSLMRLLNDAGFTSVLECLVPAEPFKRADRVTLVARRGTPVRISSYPWVNGLNDDQIQRRLESEQPPRHLGARLRLEWDRLARRARGVRSR